MNKELSGVETKIHIDDSKVFKGRIVLKSTKETGEYLKIYKFVIDSGSTVPDKRDETIGISSEGHVAEGNPDGSSRLPVHQV